MGNILLFDISPFIYIAYFAASSMLKEKATEDRLKSVTSNILLSRIDDCLSPFEGKKVTPIFCYDGLPQRKKELLQSYKSNRNHTISKELKNYLLGICNSFPGYHLINKEEEADDLIATVKEKFKSLNQDFSYFIFSRDNDLLQLADSKTTFVDPVLNGKVRDRKYLIEKFGIENFKHIILHKICFGDTSDNIEGIFKGKRRAPIIEQIKSCKKFSEFLNLEIIQQNNLEDKAKELFSIIKLKNNIIYEKTINRNIEFLKQNIFINFEFSII